MSNQVCTEVAEQEFERFAQAWDIMADTSKMDPEDNKSFFDAKNRIVGKIEQGAVTIGDNGEFTYKLMHPFSDTESVELRLERADMLTMDKYKDKQKMHMLNAYIGSMAGWPPVMVNKLHPVDHKIVQGVALLFLGS